MSHGNPSREQLAKYFKENRRYFDDLAKHYKESDREYYDSHIAPLYYGKTFAAVKSGGCGAKGFIVLAALGVVAAGAVGIFFLLDVRTEPETIEYKIEKPAEENTPTVPGDETGKTKEKVAPPDSPAFGSDYDDGMYYFQKGNYKKAEEHFKKVKEDDPNYYATLIMLQTLREMKKGGVY